MSANTKPPLRVMLDAAIGTADEVVINGVALDEFKPGRHLPLWWQLHMANEEVLIANAEQELEINADGEASIQVLSPEGAALTLPIRLSVLRPLSAEDLT